jgi:hypothetical protein
MAEDRLRTSTRRIQRTLARWTTCRWTLGPTPTILMADWMAATLDGKPFPSEKWYVESTGRIIKTPL